MIKIRIKDIELTKEEAKELYLELCEMFGQEKPVPYIHIVPSHSTPVQPYWEYFPHRVTWSSAQASQAMESASQVAAEAMTSAMASNNYPDGKND